MICLDTNIAIAIINAAKPVARDRLEAALDAGMEVALPIIVLHELAYCAMKSQRRVRNVGVLSEFLGQGIQLLDFGADDAREASDIRVSLERAGTPIGPYDVLIAAQARRRGALLVTGNGREFRRVPGLLVEDWAAA
jgi:tRNA(fMet)-specific endonuclease VapC